MVKNKNYGKSNWVDPDDAPELTEDFFANADLMNGNNIIRRGRGRPKRENTKKIVTIRLDADVLDAFKREGDGWQTRINSFLRNYIPSH